MHIYETQQPQPVSTLRCNSQGVHTVKFSSDSKWLASVYVPPHLLPSPCRSLYLRKQVSFSLFLTSFNLHTKIRTHIRVHTCTHARIHTHWRTGILCTCVYTAFCPQKLASKNIFSHTHTTHMHTHTHTHTRIRTHALPRTHTCGPALTHAAYTHKHMHTMTHRFLKGK